MKPLYENLFFDMKENGMTEEEFCNAIGGEVKNTLNLIEFHLRAFNTKQALDFIKEVREEF